MNSFVCALHEIDRCGFTPSQVPRASWDGRREGLWGESGRVLPLACFPIFEPHSVADRMDAEDGIGEAGGITLSFLSWPAHS